MQSKLHKTKKKWLSASVSGGSGSPERVCYSQKQKGKKSQKCTREVSNAKETLFQRLYKNPNM